MVFAGAVCTTVWMTVTCPPGPDPDPELGPPPLIGTTEYVALGTKTGRFDKSNGRSCMGKAWQGVKRPKTAKNRPRLRRILTKGETSVKGVVCKYAMKLRVRQAGEEHGSG